MPVMTKDSLAEGERAERFCELAGKLGSVEKAALGLGLSTATPWYHMRKNPEFKARVYAAIEEARADREQAMIAEVDKHIGWKLINAEGFVLDKNGEPLLGDDFEPIHASSLTVDELVKMRRALMPKKTTTAFEINNGVTQDNGTKIIIELGGESRCVELSDLPKTVDAEFEEVKPNENVAGSWPKITNDR